MARPADAAALAHDLACTIRAPMLVERSEVSVGASVGIAMAGQEGDTPDALYRSADRAKAEGCGTWCNAA